MRTEVRLSHNLLAISFFSFPMTVHFGSAFNLITQHVSHSLIDYLDLKIVQQLIEEVEWSSVSVYLSEVFSNQDYVSASFQQVNICNELKLAQVIEISFRKSLV